MVHFLYSYKPDSRERQKRRNWKSLHTLSYSISYLLLIEIYTLPTLNLTLTHKLPGEKLQGYEHVSHNSATVICIC